MHYLKQEDRKQFCSFESMNGRTFQSKGLNQLLTDLLVILL